jgi:hypothetical protein
VDLPACLSFAFELSWVCLGNLERDSALGWMLAHGWRKRSEHFRPPVLRVDVIFWNRCPCNDKTGTLTPLLIFELARNPGVFCE